MKHLSNIGFLICTLFLSMLIVSGCAKPKPPSILESEVDQSKLKEGIYAVFDTSRGEIVLELFYKKAPMTVTNFVGLAEGTKDSNKPKGTPFYDGSLFFNVLEKFGVQGGDPEGTGKGGPGYTFPDEFNPGLTHDEPGILSMSNYGKNTNGSQFFITLIAVPWFDNKHSVFGKVVTGLDIVNQIAKGDILESVHILRIGEDAKNFETDQSTFKKLKKAAVSRLEKAKEEEANKLKEFVKKYWPKAKKKKSGIWYVITKKGHGPKPIKGQRITIHYEETIVNGEMYLSSRDRLSPLTLTVGMGKAHPIWENALLDMKRGERRVLIVPYPLAYGEKGHSNLVPPKSDIVFDLELIRIE